NEAPAADVWGQKAYASSAPVLAHPASSGVIRAGGYSASHPEKGHGGHAHGEDAGGLTLTVASYNIHKAIGRDRKRDAERILTVLGELDADVIALQEADLRFGSRSAVLPKEALHEQHWQIVP